MRSARNLLEAALEQHRAGELVLAEHLYRQVIDAEPNNAHAWHLLGALAGDQGDAALAIECLNKAIRLAKYVVAQCGAELFLPCACFFLDLPSNHGYVEVCARVTPDGVNAGYGCDVCKIESPSGKIVE